MCISTHPESSTGRWSQVDQDLKAILSYIVWNHSWLHESLSQTNNQTHTHTQITTTKMKPTELKRCYSDWIILCTREIVEIEGRVFEAGWSWNVLGVHLSLSGRAGQTWLLLVLTASCTSQLLTLPGVSRRSAGICPAKPWAPRPPDHKTSIDLKACFWAESLKM